MDKVKEFITSKWQTQWESEEHGKETHKYIQDVTFANKNKNWFKLNRYSTYLITGYRPINSTLCRRRLADSGTCPVCQESEETTEHYI